MAPRIHYIILPVGGIEDTISWEMHCNAVNNFIKYCTIGLIKESEDDKYFTEPSSKEDNIKLAISWAIQLNLIEVCE